MRKIVVAYAFIALMFSCSKEVIYDNPVPEDDSLITVTLPVCVSEQEVITRATDENRIEDVNLYLVHGQSIMVHSYNTSSSSVRFRCPPGNYRLYVIANHHAALDIMTVENLMDYTIQNNGYQYDDLPMTAVEQIEIKATAQEVSLPVLQVKRMMAKINYSIVVDKAVSDIEIKSVQFMSLPRSFKPFRDLAPNMAPDAYRNGVIVSNKEDSSRMSGTVYLLPNIQGVVPEINTPEQKNAQFAPAQATRMRIRAKRGNKILDYTIYLGENETSDFNLRPNTAHTLHVRILNDNEIDLRVKSYTIEVQCDIDAVPENGIYLEYAPIRIDVNVSGQVEDAKISCELVVKEGNYKFFALDGKPGGKKYSLPLRNINGSNFFMIRYEPENFAPENVLLIYRLVFRDQHGFVTQYEFSYCFAKVVKVYTKWFDGGNGYGTVSSPDALHAQRGGTLSSEYFLFYCSDAGCTLVATPDTNRMLYGWYREHNHNGLISMDKSFLYTPISNYDTIYAYFL